MTQYLQSVLGYSTVKAGAVLLPQAAVIMVCAPLSNVWVQRFGNKIVVTAGLLLVTSAFALFTTFEPNSSVLHVIAITMLMGAGMANVMAPCTDSIMGSLPRAKAGVGSAVNDTTRQMGGAVGVAVFGSIMASHFRGSISRALGGALPPQLFAQVKDNVGQAVGAAHQGGPTGLRAPDHPRRRRQLRQRPAHRRLGRGRHHAARRDRCGGVPAVASP